MERRTFLRLLASGTLTSFLPTCLVKPPPLSEDPFRQENAELRAKLLGQMADLFIEKTNYNGSRELLLTNWEWGFAKDSYKKFQQQFPKEPFPAHYNAVTVGIGTVTPTTFMDMYQFNTFKFAYTTENKQKILKAVILHEMEHRTQTAVTYESPKPLVNPVDNQALIDLSGVNGFVLKATTDQSTGHELNEAAAEAAAVLSLDRDYYGGRSPDRFAPTYHQNLDAVITELGIPWQEVIEFHRAGKPFEFGKRIADELGYKVQDESREAAAGLTLAYLAADGRKRDFLGLLSNLNLQWPSQNLPLITPEASQYPVAVVSDLWKLIPVYSLEAAQVPTYQVIFSQETS